MIRRHPRLWPRLNSPPSCPDCGASQVRSLGPLPEGLSFAGRRLQRPMPGGELLHCRRCDLRWRWPQRSDYAALYDNDCLDAWALGPLRVDQRLVLGAVEGRPGGRLLDFGCYRGEFLARLPEGIERFGVEVSRAAAQQAARHAGAQVVGALDQFDPTLRFDTIVAMDVIEHVPSPRALMAQWLARLAPGGRLIVTTGDGGAALWRWAGSRWWYCQFPEHIAFISGPWLQHHLASLGAQLRGLRRFNYLDASGGAGRRWRAWLSYMARPGHHARKRVRRLAEEGRDIGIPGAGLSADHLLVQIER